jgi:hypothetical protein
MAHKLLALRDYATNILQKNVIKTMYSNVYSYTDNQKKRIYSELLEDECKSIINYQFCVENDIIGLPTLWEACPNGALPFLKIHCPMRIKDKPIVTQIKTGMEILDMDHTKIIKRFINTHKDDVCQAVLRKQFPGIEFKKILECDLGCHFKANQNQSKFIFYELPNLNVESVLKEN